MNEIIFLAGLATGLALGVPALVRLWQVDVLDTSNTHSPELPDQERAWWDDV